MLVHHLLPLQTFESFWLPAAEAAVQRAGRSDGGKGTLEDKWWPLRWELSDALQQRSP